MIENKQELFVHDLQQLLQIILCGVHVLRRTDSKAVTCQIVRQIEESARTASRLAKCLSNDSKGPAQRPSTNLALWLRKVEPGFASLVYPRVLRVLKLDEPIWVACSEVELVRMLINVVENALQTTDSNGRIIIRARELDQRVSLEVIDNGKGLDQSVTGTLFQGYASNREDEGSNPNLWSTQRALQDLGGALQWQSRPGRTSVRLLLPATERMDSLRFLNESA